MVDIETLGTSSSSVIVSIGAIKFTSSPPIILDTFYEVLDIKKLPPCFTTDISTIQWWFQQNEAAKKVFSVKGEPPDEVFSKLALFLQDGKRYWAQGTSFDFPILEHAFHQYGIEVPWKFWQQRDTRTIFDIYNFSLKNVPQQEEAHNALVDCKRQLTGLWFCLENK